MKTLAAYYHQGLLVAYFPNIISCFSTLWALVLRPDPFDNPAPPTTLSAQRSPPCQSRQSTIHLHGPFPWPPEKLTPKLVCSLCLLLLCMKIVVTLFSGFQTGKFGLVNTTCGTLTTECLFIESWTVPEILVCKVTEVVLDTCYLF